MATKKKTTKTTTIPRFKTEVEEAAWWDAHPDFLAEQFEKAAKEGRLQRGIPKSKSVTIRVPVRIWRPPSAWPSARGFRIRPT